jgi:hypothetical protein
MYLVTIHLLGHLILGIVFVANNASGSRISSLAHVYAWPGVKDPPNDVSNLCVKPLLAGHYFGDFQSDYCRFQTGNIYGATPSPTAVLTDTQSKKSGSPTRTQYNDDQLDLFSEEFGRIEQGRQLSAPELADLQSLKSMVFSGQLDKVTSTEVISQLSHHPSWYPPSFYLVTWPILAIESMSLSFGVTLLLSMMLWIPCLMVCRMTRLQILSQVLILYPFFVAVFRGNIGWILATPLLAIFLTLRSNANRYQWLPLLVAICLKPQLCLLALIFVAARQIRPLINTVIGIVTMNGLGAIVLMDHSEEFFSFLERITGRQDVNLRIGLLFHYQAIIDSIRFSLENAFHAPQFFQIPTLLLLALVMTIVVRKRVQHLRSSVQINPTQFAGWLGESDTPLLLVLASLSVLASEPAGLYALSPFAAITLTRQHSDSFRAAITVLCSPLLVPTSLESLEHLIGDPSDSGELLFHGSVGTIVSGLILLTLALGQSPKFSKSGSPKQSDS